MALNSPPESVVGTLIWRTVGAFISGGPMLPSAPLTGRSLSISSAARMSLARHICTALAPSVMEPPPMVTMRSAFAALAASVAAITARPRRVRRHPVEAAGAAIAERAAHLLDLVRVPVERVAHHQENARRAEALRLRGHRLRRRLAEHHLIHLAEDHASRWQHVVLPIDRFARASRATTLSGGGYASKAALQIDLAVF